MVGSGAGDADGSGVTRTLLIVAFLLPFFGSYKNCITVNSEGMAVLVCIALNFGEHTFSTLALKSVCQVSGGNPHLKPVTKVV